MGISPPFSAVVLVLLALAIGALPRQKPLTLRGVVQLDPQAMPWQQSLLALLRGSLVFAIAAGLDLARSPLYLLALLALSVGGYLSQRQPLLTAIAVAFFWADWPTATIALLLGIVSVIVVQNSRWSWALAIAAFPVVTALMHGQDGVRVALTVLLALWLVMVSTPLSPGLDTAFSRPERGIRDLTSLVGTQAPIGHRAHNLVQLHQQSGATPPAWVLQPGDDPEWLLQVADVTPEEPLAVLSSPVGGSIQAEDCQIVRDLVELRQAIYVVLADYQRQPVGSGVAIILQRSPLARYAGWVMLRSQTVDIWGLPGDRQNLHRSSRPRDHYRWENQTVSLMPNSTGDLPRTVLDRLMARLEPLQRSLSPNEELMLEWADDGEQAWLLQLFVTVCS
ncbi:hypothetical protein [Synechococcus elongatus]|uniref:Uncharacterized protein n=2 Tax=Synechococcus elongatus TaxID=32046 RepID=Q31QL6_SYNE7|nr:hypothetical protein [Synechococcus elongatus]ABB56653.1 conserved hypothetical protein [Synechococcus elongatus PCC 7942 = FACHB-805]AJD58802.1 hypothetical protein M744_13735 [Synechococcus elongatus UTEX 2973]MBD2588997.1 hypothetical protein [Synechococcus elongatus FACHB-242]MBD2690063.1 hypothetical protein [Synechococcus elongatus FACHB-1061]MBD2708506.1 hypothetical protein [Synechococcus elongatus PCC 7942 = FACHB-805]